MTKSIKVFAVALVLAVTTAVYAQGGLDPIALANQALAQVKIEFPTNQYTVPKNQVTTITQTVAPKVKDVLAQLKENQRIFIIGHTDTVGERKLNKEISIARARHVYVKLVAQGIDKKYLEYVGVWDTEGSERTVTFKIANLGDIEQKR